MESKFFITIILKSDFARNQAHLVAFLVMNLAEWLLFYRHNLVNN